MSLTSKSKRERDAELERRDKARTERIAETRRAAEQTIQAAQENDRKARDADVLEARKVHEKCSADIRKKLDGVLALGAQFADAPRATASAIVEGLAEVRALSVEQLGSDVHAYVLAGLFVRDDRLGALEIATHTGNRAALVLTLIDSKTGPAQLTRAIEDLEIAVETTLQRGQVHADAKRTRVLRELVSVGDVGAALRDLDTERMAPEFERRKAADEGTEHEDTQRAADALAARMPPLTIPKWLNERPAERSR